MCSRAPGETEQRSACRDQGRLRQRVWEVQGPGACALTVSSQPPTPAPGPLRRPCLQDLLQPSEKQLSPAGTLRSAPWTGPHKAGACCGQISFKGSRGPC